MERDQKTNREKLYHLLGDLPPRNAELAAETIDSWTERDMVIEKLLLHLNGIEPVPAYFIKPEQALEPLPLVLYNHSHGGFYEVGKEEVRNAAPYQAEEPYADALCRQGYAVLCIDHWGFGERRTQTEGQLFKRMLWQGQVLWGMMVFDSLRALDYAVSRPDVNAERISTLGMSMGSTMAWWTAALDSRIKVTVDLCSLSEYEVLLETGAYDGHGIYYYVPGLLKHFRASDINALIAPRHHLSLAGTKDAFTPPKGLDLIDKHTREVYQSKGAGERWKQLRFTAGHEETAEMRKEALDFVRKHL